MIYQLPFVFETVCIPKGKKNVDNVVFGDYLPCEFPEIRVSELEVAAVADNGRTQVNFHYYDEAFWQKAPRQREFRPDRDIPALESPVMMSVVLSAMSRHNLHRKQSLLYFLKPSMGCEVLRWNNDAAKAVFSSDYEMEYAKAAELARSLMLVDGELWHRIDEPKFFLDCGPSPKLKVSTQFEEGKFPYERTPWEYPVFRGDRREDAIDYMRIRCGDTEFHADALEIRMPEAFIFDDEATCVSRTASSVIERSKNILPGLTKDGAMSWYALRDAVRIGAGAEDCAALLADLEPSLAGSVLHREVVDAVERWNLRPLHASSMTF